MRKYKDFCLHRACSSLMRQNIHLVKQLLSNPSKYISAEKAQNKGIIREELRVSQNYRISKLEGT